MVPYEFIACIEGYNRAQGGGKPKPPSEEEFEAAKRTLH